MPKVSLSKAVPELVEGVPELAEGWYPSLSKAVPKPVEGRYLSLPKVSLSKAVPERGEGEFVEGKFYWCLSLSKVTLQSD